MCVEQRLVHLVCERATWPFLFQPETQFACMRFGLQHQSTFVGLLLWPPVPVSFSTSSNMEKKPWNKSMHLWAILGRRCQVLTWFFLFSPSESSMFLRPNSLGKHYAYLRPPNFMLRYKKPEGKDFKWMEWRSFHFLKQTYSISFHVSEMKTKNTN